ncbi:MAG TPA: response regulator [Thermoanaerobaculia bacterium]|nr:response regulator [Thermoanaerobaculia bacterium]
MTSLPSVLVVEDDPAIRSLLTAALTRQPLNVDSAHDGVAALERLACTDYVVVILDLMMPRMNGYAFLDALREVRPGARPVVLVMTAGDHAQFGSLDPELVHACIRKPFDVHAVVDTIRGCAEIMSGVFETDSRSTATSLPQGMPPDR